MLKQTVCSGSVMAPSGQCSEEQPLGWNRESRLRKCLPSRKMWLSPGHIYRAERLLSLLQAIDANPEATQIYLTAPTRAFRDIPIFKLESFTDPHHLSNSCPGTHSYSQQLFGWHEHSFISHPPSLSLHCTPFPWCKDSAAATHDLLLLFHATPALPIVADSLRLCMASCPWH
ncbi:uncharacterized protein K441DRAFT_327162 [Cenococcum geophilum 1.58]|uniref:Uncharacterized protein n=1 Tax=Cenococcum geophilum 1.58 TaxID=794803 RepID=A0ACC8EP13_9PEZI|nr:hypothetical protein K441DRAFT_327162 [Cenococcum geophilum 1.58]